MRIAVSHEARANLDRLGRESDATHVMMSRVLKRSDGYIGRYIREGVPALLTDHDAQLLAAFLGCDPRLLGVVDGQRQQPARKDAALPWWKKPMPRV